MLAELLLVGLAVAAPVVVWPGTAATALPCAVDPSDACWERSEVLSRFAPVRGTLGDVVRADIRLAHDDGDLLVRLAGVPDGFRVEVGLQPDPAGGRDSIEAVLLAGSSSPVVTRFTPRRTLSAGQVRGLRLALLQTAPDGSVVETLPWTPTGDGDLDRAASLLVARRPSKTVAPQVDLVDDTLTVRLEGADEVSLTAEREPEPAWSVGIDPPWSVQGEAELEAPTPHASGWYLLEATWENANGRTEANGRWRVWLDAPDAPGVSALGMHPAPDALARLDQPGFEVTADTRIALGELAWVGTAVLVADELERTTGHRPELTRRARRGDIWIGLTSAPLPRRLRPVGATLPPVETGGFGMAVSERGAVVRADTQAAATFGALALVDALGMEGRAPAFQASDAPDVPGRVYYLEVVTRSRSPIEFEAYKDHLRRLVPRGRYEYVVLSFKDGLVLDSHPELASRVAISKDQARELIDALRDLGITPIPGGQSPGHSQWLTRAHPELEESNVQAQVCTRHPGTWQLLSEVYEELLDLFSDDGTPPPWFHIGHDEVRLDVEAGHDEDRCPRCQGTPRWQLYAESMQWLVAWLADRGVHTMAWADMLNEDWYEDFNDIHRAAALLGPETRDHLLLLSWADVGDPVPALRAQGFEVGRVHAGYRDWKRDGLADAIAQGIAVEGTAQYSAFPTSNVSTGMGAQSLRNAWPTAILAGATGWRSDLVTTAIDTTLAQSVELLGYRPGARHVPGWTGLTAPLVVSGEAWRGPPMAPPAAIEVDGLVFEVAMHAGSKDNPARVEVGRPVAAVSLLETIALTQQAHRAHAQALQRAVRIEEIEVAEVVVTWADGEQQSVPWRLGVTTQRPDFGPRAAILWETVGAAAVPAFEGGPAERWVARWDWINPRPEVAVTDLVVAPTVEDGQVLLLGATALVPSP